MKLHFDPNQQYQKIWMTAILSIVNVFEGQPLNDGDFSFSISNKNLLLQLAVVGNRLSISEEQTLENVRSVQKKNKRRVYFVTETKSEGQELKTSEKIKIKCGQAHFKEFDGVNYRQVATVGELDD